MPSRRIRIAFIASIIVALCAALAITSFAAPYQRQATLNYTGINITLDGAPVALYDANGRPLDIFAIDGTTYLPMRGIADLLGVGVMWDGATQTVKLTSPQNAVSTPSQSSRDPEPAPAAEQTGPTLYITKTGKRYHHDPTCNGGTYFIGTWEDVERRGLSPCDKCVIKGN